MPSPKGRAVHLCCDCLGEIDENNMCDCTRKLNFHVK